MDHYVDTVRLTTAQALVRFLQAQYSERDGQEQRAVPAVFGIFGHGNVLGVGQALQEEGAELPFYQPKNEQAMVHAAIGYAKASRRLAALACTASIGPGSTNMLTGAATATTNRLPVLLLPSDTFATRRQGPVLQQLEHPLEADTSVNDAFRPLSRFFDRIARPEQLLTALPQAMRVLLDPAETGAVTISLHQDVQGEAFDWPMSFFERRVWPVTRRPPAASEIDAVAELLRQAERPLAIAGGGVRYSEAEHSLATFAEELGVPVVETSAGKGSLAGSAWIAGGVGVNGTRAANELARDADLVLCLGTRLSDFTTGSHSLFQHPQVRFVGVNVNANDAHKLSASAIVADIRETLDALRKRMAAWSAPAGYRQVVSKAVAGWRADLDADVSAGSANGRLGQGHVLSTINKTVRAGDWVVAAAGWQPGDLLKLWDTPPGSFTHIEFAYSCMGHEIPAGLGIRMREGDEPEVIVVIGDGTYLMQPTELVTSVQEGLRLTVVVLDNGGYQSINRLALTGTGSAAGNEFRRRDGERLAIDYVANARSMGCQALPAGSAEDLGAALRAAREAAVTTVIVCPTTPDGALLPSGAFWDLGVPEVSSVPDTRRLAGEVIKARVAQRPYLGPAR
jgi:3D-(3,5/4)-trihydroxycyclohexane-1,2-dione acylhydrolase (decyclizing)